MSDGTKVLHVPDGPAGEVVEKIKACMPGLDPGGQAIAHPLPQGCVVEPIEDFMARGRVENCTCDLIQCVCSQASGHKEDCRLRRALTCAIGFGCEKHDLEVCPECDSCDCGASDA